ncbi:MAG: hypothetical protein M1821_009943 [Bathelium mastoideum]|nr:MAG: hypothetical protein M1821_009943 [Bathelium mastoideum]
MDKHFTTPNGADYGQGVHFPTEWSLETPGSFYDDPMLHQRFDSESDQWHPSAGLYQPQVVPKNESSEAFSHGIPFQTTWTSIEGFQSVDNLCGLPSISSPYSSLASGVDMATSAPFQSLANLHQADALSVQATVVPSQTFVEVDLDTASHVATYSDSMKSSFASTELAISGYSSDGPLSPRDSPERIAEEPGWVSVRHEPDYVTISRIHETSTGAKGVKKSRKTQKHGHGKARRKTEAALIETERFDIKISKDTFIKYQQARSRDEKIAPEEEKTPCGMKLNTGEICDKAFGRPEHLNRHRKTHTAERPFECPICISGGQHKSFGRQDNRQAHYETHLIKKRGSRNVYVPYDELCRCIRLHETREVAEKTIKKLEKGKAQGKFDPPTSES